MTKTIEQIEAESANQVVAHVGRRAITRRELSTAFDIVAPKDHWKNPIDATIEVDFNTADLIREAVVFFTGSVPTFEVIETVKDRGDGKGKYRVTAAGYYNTIGA